VSISGPWPPIERPVIDTHAASTVATARASGSRARELHRHAAHDDTDVAGGVDDLDG
jgi:hypothetical protein